MLSRMPKAGTFKKGFDRRRNYHGRTVGSKNKMRLCPRCHVKFRLSSLVALRATLAGKGLGVTKLDKTIERLRGIRL